MQSSLYNLFALSLILLPLSVGAETDSIVQTQTNAGVDDVWAEDDWGDDTTVSSPWLWSGFIEAGYGHFTGTNVTASSRSLSELRTQLDVDYHGEDIRFSFTGDLLQDEALNSTDLAVRELSITLNPFTNTDVIVGRQIMTWGTGDYLFLNDLFAKDWQSFFAGRDDAYLKAPNDAIRLMQYFGDFSLDLVYSPEFTSDNFITGERFSFYSAQSQSIVAPQTLPLIFSSAEQYSVRVAATLDAVEYAIYGYKGLWTSPFGSYQLDIDRTAGFFPQLRSFGASIRAPLLSGVFNAEFASYNSIDDPNGNNPNIINDQLRFLLGYETEVYTDITAGLQFYLEHSRDYERMQPTIVAPGTQVEENRSVVTLRITHQALQQALTSRLFVFYSPTDKDAYLKPSISYRYNDEWLFTTGANVFIGERNNSFFGQHEDNSNLWLRVRFNY